MKEGLFKRAVWLVIGTIITTSIAGIYQDSSFYSSMKDMVYGRHEKNVTEKDTTKESTEPILGIFIITDQSANVRSGPGTKYGIVDVAKQGDEFEVTDLQQGWYVTTDGGYISSTLGTFTENAETEESVEEEAKETESQVIRIPGKILLSEEQIKSNIQDYALRGSYKEKNRLFTYALIVWHGLLVALIEVVIFFIYSLLSYKKSSAKLLTFIWLACTIGIIVLFIRDNTEYKINIKERGEILQVEEDVNMVFIDYFGKDERKQVSIQTDEKYLVMYGDYQKEFYILKKSTKNPFYYLTESRPKEEIFYFIQ